MPWWQVAAAVAPAVVGAFQKKPKTPSYRAPQLPDRSSYVNQMLESGFDPQSELYRLAQDSAIDRINRGIARQGLVGSSAGLSAQRTGMADLANRFLMSELERRKIALGAANQYDQVRGRMDRHVADQQYAADMAGYNDAMQRGAGVSAGIGNILGAVGQHYAGEQATQERGEMRDILRAQYGIPHPATQSPVPYGPPAPSYGPPQPAMGAGYQLPPAYDYGYGVA